MTIRRTALPCVLIPLLLLGAGLTTAGKAATISESQLRMCRTAILSRFIEDSPRQERAIRGLMESMVSHGRSRIRLLDKFALFYADMTRRGISITSTRFAADGDRHLVLMVFQDGRDKQQYTLNLEFAFERGTGSSTLTDIYFSVVFAERLKELTRFFRSR